MRTPSHRAGRVAVAAATPVAVIAAAALVWQSSYAAFSGSTRNSGNEWETGAVALTDDDAGSARFQVANMTPGDTETKCIKVTATTDVPGEVRGYAINPVASSRGLESHVLVTVRAGNGGGFGSCSGFVSQETVVPTASLAQLAAFNSYDAGLGGWDVTAGTSTRTYEITWSFDTTGMSQSAVDQLQGSSTGIDFQWELQSS